jgi:hypothetical protein
VGCDIVILVDNTVVLKEHANSAFSVGVIRARLRRATSPNQLCSKDETLVRTAKSRISRLHNAEDQNVTVFVY